MRLKENETAVSIKLTVEWINRIDTLAKELGMSRHQLLKNMTEVGLDELKAMNRYGLFQLGITLRDFFTGDSPPSQIDGPQKSIPVYIRNDQIELIDKYAQRGKFNRQQMLRNIIDVATAELELLMATGIGPAYLLGAKLKDIFNKVIESGEHAFNGHKKQI